MPLKARVTHDDISRNKVNCPYCEHTNFIITSFNAEERIVPIPSEKDDRGYPIKQVAYRTELDRVCDNCGKLFTIDKGISKYNVYKTPRNCCNQGEIRLMAEFISDNKPNYSLYIAGNPSDETKPIYFIESQDDTYPIFISEKEAKKYLKDHKEALSSIFCIIMTRYR